MLDLIGLLVAATSARRLMLVLTVRPDELSRAQPHGVRPPVLIALSVLSAANLAAPPTIRPRPGLTLGRPRPCERD
jgi:hypothetical protein